MKNAALSVLDPRSRAVADRLQNIGQRQMGALLRHYLPMLPRLLMRRSLGAWHETGFFADKLLPLAREQLELIYLLSIARRPRLTVEFGTSFGVSTIYLAAAARDASASGRVIGTEIEPAKVQAARANLAEAGLESFVEIREGDALETLRSLDQPVDLLLIDGWPTLARPILDLLEPHLTQDALIVVDNVGQFAADTAPVIARLSQAKHYRAARLPLRGGTVIAVRNMAGRCDAHPNARGGARFASE